MSNSTLTYFILGAYHHVGNIRYFYFSITAFFYFVIILLNMSLIVLICVNRHLHEPMYIFLCSLFINEVCGSTGLFPFLLIQILSDIHTVSVTFCFLQFICIYTYATVEFCILAIMSYDRYVAICRPLQYNSHMTIKRVVVCIAVIWLLCFAKVLCTFSLSVRLKFCGNILNKLYCQNYLIVKLSCSDTTVNNIYGLVGTAATILFPLIPILVSYFKILQVCFSGSKQTRQKAVSTCSPQLVSLLNFSFCCFFEIIQSRFDLTSWPRILQDLLSLYFLIMQPLLNPVMYGLQISKMRKTFVLYYKMMTGHKNAVFVVRTDIKLKELAVKRTD